jgi:hypothetical protein
MMRFLCSCFATLSKAIMCHVGKTVEKFMVCRKTADAYVSLNVNYKEIRNIQLQSGILSGLSISPLHMSCITRLQWKVQVQTNIWDQMERYGEWRQSDDQDKVRIKVFDLYNLAKQLEVQSQSHSYSSLVHSSELPSTSKHIYMSQPRNKKRKRSIIFAQATSYNKCTLNPRYLSLKKCKVSPKHSLDVNLNLDLAVKNYTTKM